MGNLNRRLEALEDRMPISSEEAARVIGQEMICRLTDEELDWLAEPARPGAVSREDLSPEAEEEMRRRWMVLCERYREILERDPVS